MTRLTCIFVALGLAAAASTALAAQPGKSQPVQMTDAQMDDVTAGELIIVFQDSLNNLTINFGGGGGNGLAKGWQSGKGNPHKDLAPSPVSMSKHGQTVVFTVNINVNTASGG
jgi:hypothetical protein